MGLEAGLEERRFRWEGMRRGSLGLGRQGEERYDACYYVVKAESALLKSGVV